MGEQDNAEIRMAVNVTLDEIKSLVDAVKATNVPNVLGSLASLRMKALREDWPDDVRSALRTYFEKEMADAATALAARQRDEEDRQRCERDYYARRLKRDRLAQAVLDKLAEVLDVNRTVDDDAS